MAEEFTRRSSDNSWLVAAMAGLPWQVKVILIIALIFGPLGVFAAFFMSLWAGWVPSPITVNTQLLQETKAIALDVQKTLNMNIGAMQARVTDSQYRDEQMIRLQLATCRAVARDTESRRECDGYWKRP